MTIALALLALFAVVALLARWTRADAMHTRKAEGPFPLEGTGLPAYS